MYAHQRFSYVQLKREKGKKNFYFKLKLSRKNVINFFYFIEHILIIYRA